MCFNRGNNQAELDLVNAWRAVNHLAPLALSPDQLERVLRARPARQQAAAPIAGKKIELSLNVFNALNRTNLLSNVNTSVITNALASNFGQILSAYPKRQAAAALRFTF